MNFDSLIKEHVIQNPAVEAAVIAIALLAVVWIAGTLFKIVK